MKVQVYDFSIEATRRELRRLRILDWTLFVVGVSFIVWVCWAIFFQDRRDLFYGLPSIFGSVTTISRFLVHKVRSFPRPVATLLSPDPATADAAWAVVEAHRKELLGVMHVPGTIHEAPVNSLSRNELVGRLARLGTTDWRRILKGWLLIWVPLLIVVFVLTLTYVPRATRSY